jgi:hypothetical protein
MGYLDYAFRLIPAGMEVDHINHVKSDNRITFGWLPCRESEEFIYPENNTSGMTGIRRD